MNITRANILDMNYNVRCPRVRVRDAVIKLRFRVGTRARGRSATRTRALPLPIRADAGRMACERVVEIFRPLFKHEIISWRLVYRLEADYSAPDTPALPTRTDVQGALFMLALVSIARKIVQGRLRAARPTRSRPFT